MNAAVFVCVRGGGYEHRRDDKCLHLWLLLLHLKVKNSVNSFVCLNLLLRRGGPEMESFIYFSDLVG